MWDPRAVEEGPRRSEVPIHNTLKLRGPPLGWLGCCDGQFSLSTYLDLEQAKRPPPLCVCLRKCSQRREDPSWNWVAPCHELRSWNEEKGEEEKASWTLELISPPTALPSSSWWINSFPNVNSKKPFSLGCCRCWVTLGRKVPGTFISPWSCINVEPETYANHRLCRRRVHTQRKRENREDTLRSQHI